MQFLRPHQKKGPPSTAMALLGLFGLFLAGASASAGNEVTTESLLQSVRVAIGFDSLMAAGEVEITGESRFAGQRGEFTVLINRDGRFFQKIDGPLSMQWGYDGDNLWEIDWSGAPRILELRDREEIRALVLIQTGLWLAGDSPIRAEFVAGKSTDKKAVLSIHLDGGLFHGTMEVDRESGLPQKFIHVTMNGEQTNHFAKWNSALGFRFPHLIEIQSEGAPVDRFRATRIVRAPLFERDPYALYRTVPSGTGFSKEWDSLETVRAPTGHILIRGVLSDGKPRWFVFDTGAGSLVIDNALSEELGMTKVGDVVATGVGGAQESAFVRGKSLTLGPLSMEDPIFMTLDLQPYSKVFREKLAGIVGYEVLARTVVEIDMEGGAMAVHDPDGYELEGGEWEDLILSSRHPCVRARFEGERTGVFALDTGAAESTVSFHKPFVDSEMLLEGRETIRTGVVGVGGTIAARSGKVDWFEIGGHRFDDPAAIFIVGNLGAMNDEYLSGNVGGLFLKRFRLVFDYSNRRLAFLKR